MPRMTAKRQSFSLVCLPPDVGGLIAIGGYNGARIDVVECLGGDGATEWRRLAPLPIPLSSGCGGVYFKQRILVVGGDTPSSAKIPDMFAFNPPTGGGPGQWVTLKPKLPRPEVPYHITISGNSVLLLSKFTFSPRIQNLFSHFYWGFCSILSKPLAIVFIFF